MKNYIFLFLKGLAMGAVNKIPGVSGGTVAFITGIYEDLINSIKKINFKDLLEKDPEKVLRNSVKGMLPKNKLNRQIIKKLKIYSDEVHPHEAQNPEVLS